MEPDRDEHARRDPGARGGAPPALQINMGMTQGAVYDAVNAIERRHRPIVLMQKFNSKASKEAAGTSDCKEPQTIAKVPSPRSGTAAWLDEARCRGGRRGFDGRRARLQPSR
jgi:hypothetical protein